MINAVAHVKIMEIKVENFASDFEGYVCRLCGSTYNCDDIEKHLIHDHTEKELREYLKDPDKKDFLEN